MISSRHSRLSKSPQADLEPPDSLRMADLSAYEGETLTHRLVLPRDANHHGTLYAGVLLSLALEAGYATAFRAASERSLIRLMRSGSVTGFPSAKRR